MQANIVYPFAEWFLYYENVDVNNERITSYLKNLEYENTSQSNSSKEMYVLSHHNVLKQKFISIIEDGIHQFGYIMW